MGEVYLARDARLQRTVAIKILPAHLSSCPDLHARFVREAKSISNLQHPNIGSQDGLDYMVMEYVAGQTLNRVIPQGGLPANVATKYGLQVADALTRAHAAGIIHRDLKPANIMVDDSGVVKVLDFGLTKLAAEELPSNDVGAPMTGTGAATTPGMIVGTLAYMSPEQAEGKPIDARGDVFSFGAVFYDMLTGKKAFDADSSAALLAAVMRDDPKPVSELRRDVPSELRSIVGRCLKGIRPTAFLRALNCHRNSIAYAVYCFPTLARRSRRRASCGKPSHRSYSYRSCYSRLSALVQSGSSSATLRLAGCTAALCLSARNRG